MTVELSSLDATAQADLVRRGDATPAELVEAAIVRIEKLNPELNAVIHPLFDKAREAAASPDLPDGPFRGVPFVVKDITCHTAGDPFHEGMRHLKDLGWTEPEDSYLAAKYRSAGLVFVGRTNASELGILPAAEPEAYGPTRNPWDLGRSTGGSSGGTGAAVASRMVPVGHANDGGGSIRIPASECGLFGLKPSRGRVAQGPGPAGLVAFLQAEHVLSLSVRDSAAILDETEGPMPGGLFGAPPPARPYLEEVGADPGRLRVGILTDAPAGTTDTHPDCIAAAEDAGRLLESLGHAVEPAGLEWLGDPEALSSFLSLWAASQWWHLDRWGRRTGQAVGPEGVERLTWALAETGGSAPASQLVAAVEWAQVTTERMGRWHEDFDLLLTPTIGEPPPPLGSFEQPEDNPFQAIFRAATIVPFTPLFNVTGQPAASLPLSWNEEGLPIGVQLVAAYGREDLLFRVSAQLEEARPWIGRLPPVHA